MARILVGLIVLVRTALSAYSAYYYFEPSTFLGVTANFQFISSIAMCGLVLAFTAGLIAPLSSLLLLILYSEWDRYLETTTLGTMILVHLILLLFFTNSGWEYSVDGAVIDGAGGGFKKLLVKLYGALGLPSRRQIDCYYYLAFAAYAVTSFGALTNHVLDDFWRSGQTVEKLLTASFFCQHYALMRQIRDFSPAFFALFSKFSVLFQTIYQLGMLGLVYNRLGYLFVLGWGMGFFLISLLALELSYLAPLELVLWVTVMLPTPPQFDNPPQSRSQGPIVAQKLRTTGGIVCAFLFACFLYIFTFPVVQTRCPQLSLPQPVALLLYRIGLWCPDVFNKTDLAASDTWRVIYRIFADGHHELVPLDKIDGSRDWYYFFDPVYFGNGTYWHRLVHMPGYEPAKFHQPGMIGYQLTEKMIDYDRRMIAPRQPLSYQTEIYTVSPELSPVGTKLDSPYKVFQYDSTAPSSATITTDEK